MKDVNHVMLLGNLGQEPRVHQFDNGDNLTRLNVATNRAWKDKAGEWQNTVSWHTVVCRGDHAARASQLKKGNRVLVSGQLETRKYIKDNVEHYATEIIVAGFAYYVASQTPREHVERDAAREEQEQRPARTGSGRAPDPFEDDIPF